MKNPAKARGGLFGMSDDPNAAVITAYAERVDGPGWNNAPIWFVTRDGNGNLRQTCLQPADQTAEMLLLFCISEPIHRTMTALVAARRAELLKKRGYV